MCGWPSGFGEKDGADPRLVADSTVSNSNANRLCRISEKIELPGLGAVEEFISRHPDEQWVAFVLDVKTAHKRVKVSPDAQYLLHHRETPGGWCFLLATLVGHERLLVVKGCCGLWACWTFASASRLFFGYVC